MGDRVNKSGPKTPVSFVKIKEKKEGGFSNLFSKIASGFGKTPHVKSGLDVNSPVDNTVLHKSTQKEEKPLTKMTIRPKKEGFFTTSFEEGSDMHARRQGRVDHLINNMTQIVHGKDSKEKIDQDKAQKLLGDAVETIFEELRKECLNKDGATIDEKKLKEYPKEMRSFIQYGGMREAFNTEGQETLINVIGSYKFLDTYGDKIAQLCKEYNEKPKTY